MCEKCVEIDKQIDHYLRIAGKVTDNVTLAAIERLIARCHDEKIELHSNREQEK